MISAELERFSAFLWREKPYGKPDSVFAILDGSCDRKIRSLVKNSGLEFDCLYAGDLSLRLAEAAPYLVKLEKDHPFLETLLQRGIGNNWGIFAIVRRNRSLSELRRHFRRFLRVKDERRNVLVFRYYDPRTMRVYLPTCEQHELDFVFGDHVVSYLVEDQDGRNMLEFGFPENVLSEDSFPLR